MSIKITIPTSLDEIPLSKMLDWLALPDDMDIEERNNRALQLFAAIPSDILPKLQEKQRKEIITRIYLAINQNPEFRPRFTFRGVEYGFEPNLDEMIFGQFVDIDSIKDYRAELPRLMSILYRPITDKLLMTYRIEPYKPKEDLALYEAMPTSVAFGMMLFFWSIGSSYLNDTLRFTEPQAQANNHSKTLPTNGDGTSTYTALHKETLDDLKKLRSFRLELASFGLPSRPTWQLLINLRIENLSTDELL
jgi:hypothetical protein